MLYNICHLFIFFLIYSFIGYLVEVCFCSFHQKKLVLNRGFLIGPYLPIYGSSVVLMYYSLQKYADDPVALFAMSMIICSVMEYLTSLILEKIFKVRWWDYSHMKFNVDGRICLSNSIMFGLGSLGLFYLINPFVMGFVDSIPKTLFIIISIILFIVFITDLVLSIIVLVQLKVSSRSFVSKDVSEEIIELRNELLKKNSFLSARLLNAFNAMSGKNMDRYLEMKKDINDFRKKLKESRKEAKKRK
jgi:membrane protein